MRVTYWRDESLQKNDRSHIKAYALMSGILASLLVLFFFGALVWSGLIIRLERFHCFL